MYNKPTPISTVPANEIPDLDLQILRSFVYFLDWEHFGDIKAEKLTIENCKKAISLFQ